MRSAHRFAARHAIPTVAAAIRSLGRRVSPIHGCERVSARASARFAIQVGTGCVERGLDVRPGRATGRTDRASSACGTGTPFGACLVATPKNFLYSFDLYCDVPPALRLIPAPVARVLDSQSPCCSPLLHAPDVGDGEKSALDASKYGNEHGPCGNRQYQVKDIHFALILRIAYSLVLREVCSGRRNLMMLHDCSTPYHVSEDDSDRRTDLAPISRRFTAAGSNLSVWDALKAARMAAPGLLDQGCWIHGCRAPGCWTLGQVRLRVLARVRLAPAARACEAIGPPGVFAPLPPAYEGPRARLGEKCGLAARRSPAGVTDAPAPRTFPSPLMHSPSARRGSCELRPRATRPVSARLSRITTVASHARMESPSSTGRTVRDARSRSTHAPNLPLNRGQLQTWTDWINEWTCDQGNERSVGSGTIRM